MKKLVWIFLVVLIAPPIHSKELLSEQRQCLIAHAQTHSGIDSEYQTLDKFNLSFTEGFLYIEKIQGDDLGLTCFFSEHLRCNFYSYKDEQIVSSAVFEPFAKYVFLTTYSPDYGAFALSCT